MCARGVWRALCTQLNSLEFASEVWASRPAVFRNGAVSQQGHANAIKGNYSESGMPLAFFNQCAPAHNPRTPEHQTQTQSCMPHTCAATRAMHMRPRAHATETIAEMCVCRSAAMQRRCAATQRRAPNWVRGSHRVCQMGLLVRVCYVCVCDDRLCDVVRWYLALWGHMRSWRAAAYVHPTRALCSCWKAKRHVHVTDPCALVSYHVTCEMVAKTKHAAMGAAIAMVAKHGCAISTPTALTRRQLNAFARRRESPHRLTMQQRDG